MIQPHELKLDLPMEVANGTLSTTGKVWEIFLASYEGNLNKVRALVEDCPDLIYAQYNYAPPIHLAVREGHLELVEFLLSNGAYDPSYRTYPFLEDLHSIARHRQHIQIASLLENYSADPSRKKYSRDNGRIYYKRSQRQHEFEGAVDQNDLGLTKSILKQHPEFALDQTFFWGEGILAMPVKANQTEMIQLLLDYGASVPNVLKWVQAYYFENYAGTEFILERGMNPNTQSCHHVTVLHNMAQRGDVGNVKLLLQYGAAIDLIDEEFRSTPLGMAAKWGHIEMVEYLLQQGADANRSGASWSTPLSWARLNKHTRIEEILIASGAN